MAICLGCLGDPAGCVSSRCTWLAGIAQSIYREVASIADTARIRIYRGACADDGGRARARALHGRSFDFWQRSAGHGGAPLHVCTINAIGYACILYVQYVHACTRGTVHVWGGHTQPRYSCTGAGVVLRDGHGVVNVWTIYMAATGGAGAPRSFRLSGSLTQQQEEVQRRCYYQTRVQRARGGGASGAR